jgi:hypothetical protein
MNKYKSSHRTRALTEHASLLRQEVTAPTEMMQPLIL